MKVVCETCEAKYQIPDERVAGRRLRIRCRKCGGVMEARGDELVAAAAAAPSGAIEWFASTDGTPIGPLSTDDIVSRISTGVLEWDAHVWREGYPEWTTVDASDTLVRAVASSRAAVSDEPRADSTERTSIPAHAGEEHDAYERDARTINEDAPTIAALEDSPTRVAYDETPTRMYTHSAPPGVLPPVARAAFASRPPGILPPIEQPAPFESAHANPSNGYSSNGSDVYAGAPEPYSSPSIDVSRAQLTGGPLPLPPASRAPQSAPPVRPGFAGGEGSGLIDIRALASLAQTRMNAPQPRGAASLPTEVEAAHDEADSDPLASFGTNHGVAFAALDSLAPVANRERPKDSTVPFAILTGAAMIAAASFAALYITRAPALAPPAVAAAAQPTELPSAAPRAPAAAEPAVAPAEAEPAAVAPEPEPESEAPAAAAEPEEPAVEETAAAASEQRRAPARAGGKRGARKAQVETEPAKTDKANKVARSEDDLLASEDGSEAEAKAEKAAPPPSVDDILLADPQPAKKEAAPEKPAKSEPERRSIDDLLDVAVAKKEPSAPAAAAPALPEAPSRADVLTAMRKIEDEVRACAAGEPEPVTGTASVAITVAGATGKVMSAEVTGLTGQIGSCIARVARTASFSPFTRDKFSVTYPYRFK